MSVNEKHKSLYKMQFSTFLFMGTNRPVKITDSKSGIIRRLIDVRPKGEKIPKDIYDKLFAGVKDELSAIAWHCKEVYESDPTYFEDYTPTLMMGESNDFYNFVLDSYHVFSKEDGITLKAAWELYKNYCDYAKVSYPYSMKMFKSELMTYFTNYEERVRVGEEWVRSYYSGFKKKRFMVEDVKSKPVTKLTSNDVQVKKEKLIEFLPQPSYLDKYCRDCPAQYGNNDELPRKKWDDVTTTLKDIKTDKLHYVKLNDINHIVIDFDLKDSEGNKDFERNLKEASKWPETYAELSKSGKGIHLHYIYDGDVNLLNRLYAEDIEVKVFTGNSSLRRRLSMCNNSSINHLPDILPKRKEKTMINFDNIQNEKALRTLIKKNLNKEYHSATKPSVDFIYKNLEDAYNSGITYDVSDMYNAILCFAANSTNNADYCIKLVQKMHFKSDDCSEPLTDDSRAIIFLDVEVFPNLFLVNWKKEGPKAKMVRMLNPTPTEIERILQYRIVGFNCRRYDNHMLYARFLGYTNEQLYNLSQKIILNKSRTNSEGCFQEAYNISYADIYDYAKTKQSLKKWEIQLGIHHQELGLPWDKSVPESMWKSVSEYCDNDVYATEAVWNATRADFEAREILTTLANLLCPSMMSCVNDTTNQLTGRIIFRGNKKPQSQFLYTDLSTGRRTDGYVDKCSFPGYKYEFGKSTYLDEEIGEGGYVWAQPGMYSNVVTLDVASMHPHSVLALNLFGDTYTKNFKDLVDFRLLVKHADWDAAKKMFDGTLSKFIDDIIEKDLAAPLADALKIAINSVYGLTSARFENLFRDPRNLDNIVAKRGALFMCMLKHEVIDMGAEVVHIKTDSIKIANPSKKVQDYILKRGTEFGYTFEVESKYDKFCLVNDAVYVAKCSNDPDNKEEAGHWTATGAQFQVPYVFKKCFSHEKIEFADLCETKEVKTSLYLDMNEDIDTSDEELYLKLKKVRDKEKSGEELTKPERKLLDNFVNITDEQLIEKLASYHALKFIGRVGLFSPIKEGCGGGELVRETLKKDGTYGYDAVVGTKGYRWLESEEVINNHKENDVDLSYYDNLVNDAIVTISSFGDYEWFISQD